MLYDLKNVENWKCPGIGVKAQNLVRLYQLGYTVCDGVIVPFSYFQQFCSDNALVFITPESIRRADFALAQQQELWTCWERLTKGGRELIVRSSADFEDRSGKSNAGMFASVQHVSDFEQLLEAVREVWSSYYRSSIEKDKEMGQGFGIIVQQMLLCDKSGVTFTRDPNTLNRCVWIEACKGNNEKIIQNRTAAATAKIDWAGGRPHYTSSRLLTRKEQTEQLRIAQKLEQDFGYPCDFEWGLQDHRLWIFQVRPISRKVEKGLYGEPAIEGLDCILLDRYAKPASTCYLSILDEWQHKIYLSHYTDKRGSEFSEKPLKFLYHRVYWNQRYQQQYFQDDGRKSVYKRLLLWYRVKTSWRKWYRRIPAYDKKIFQYQRRMEFETSEEGLLRLLDEICDTFCIMLGIDHYRFLSLAQILYRKVEQKAATLQYDPQCLARDLGAYVHRNQTSQANDELQDIAKFVREDVERYTFFTNTEAGDIWKKVSENPGNALDCKILQFINRHGHRGVGCDDLYEPHWRERPEFVISLLQQLVNNTQIHPDSGGKSDSGTAQSPGWRLQSLIRDAGRYMCLREDQRYYFDKSWMLLREILLKISQRFMQRSILTETNDIFFMTIQEIRHHLQFLNYPFHVEILKERIQDYERACTTAPPYMVKNSSTVPVQKSKVSKSYKAMAISGGEAAGPIRFIRGIEDLSRAQKGDIGVVNTFHPSWTPILSVVSGLIMSYGNMLSHGAVIAREYGIPVVVFNADAISMFHEGDMVRINGTTGRIHLLNHAERKSI